MRAPAVGEAAAHLGWLAPHAASLVTLARCSTISAWDELRTDPGFVLLALRQPTLGADAVPTPFVSRLDDTTLLHNTLAFLDGPGDCADWNEPGLSPILRAALAIAELSRHLAHQSGSDPECAWSAGMLTALGWLAVASVDGPAATACLEECRHADDVETVEQKHWGLDQSAIARRLCRQWRLPRWLTLIVGRLDLDPNAAASLGADLRMFRTVQLAAALVRQKADALPLRLGGDVEDNLAALGLVEGHAALADRARQLVAAPIPTIQGKSPAAEPLLRDLLQLALDNRRLCAAPALTALDDDADRLHRSLRHQQANEADRLRTQKLRALAEFAAGAGHEINNPLAVISGQAQYLLAQEPDPARQRALQKIVAQAQRVHHILTDLMQFARPSQPRKQVVSVSALLTEAMASVHDLVAGKSLRLECPAIGPLAFVDVDPKQARAALTALVRNAVEAAPVEGQVGVRVVQDRPDTIAFIVQDDGPGPGAAKIEHLFDPFYSGREAGRGRGLGLPTAWQLARINGGAVDYAGREDNVTRFVLTLPRAANPGPSPEPTEITHPPITDSLPPMPSTNGHGLT